MADDLTNFLKFEGTEFQKFILPIIPGGAVLSPSSKIVAGQLGKIPGKLTDDGWVGFANWPANRTKPTQLLRWQEWQEQGKLVIPAGLSLALYHALDIDCDDFTIAMCLEGIAREHLGITPVVRCRHGSPRRVLIYRHEDHTAPITKQSWSFEDTEQKRHLAEFLATGQFVVIEGPHAKSGQMHYWHNGGLVEHEGNIPTVNIDQVDGFFRAMHGWGEEQGFSTVKLSLPSHRGGHAPGFSVSDLMSPNLARDQEMLAKAVKAIDLDDPHFDYDRFINLLRAICAACGGDLSFMTQVVWPWVCTQKIAQGQSDMRTEDRGIEWLEERWRSFPDSTLGADYVYGWAAMFKFNDGQLSVVEDMFNGVSDGTTDDGGAQGAAGNGAGGAAPPPGGAIQPSGPIPFDYTDAALTNLFAVLHPQSRYSPDQGWMKLKSGVYVPDRCIINPIREMCSAVGDPYRAQGGQQVGIDVSMKSHKTHARVEQALRSHPAVYADPEEFDADPWLLNTPKFIIDLRNGDTHPHGMLMRNQTAVAPDLLAFGNYEMYCPRFLEVLHNMTEDEQDIALLARHGAAGLVGTDLDQLLLFIFGQGGTGKSAFSDILMLVDGSYSSAGSTSLFMKQSDKKFEVGDIVHARSLFVPETLKGMTWDDALICSLLGGTSVRVEQKYKESHDARIFMTITITGNHLPNFISTSQPNKSGIDRRLLLLKVDKLLKGKVDNHFTRKLVAEEGPAILMYFIQAAMEGWQEMQRSGSFYGSTVDKAAAAAAEYKKQMSPHLEWMSDEDVILEPGNPVNAHSVWRSYKEWIKEGVTGNSLHRETKAEFRENLIAATGRQISYGQYGDEWVFFGMRFNNRKLGDANPVNVIQSPEPGDAKK